MDWLVTDRNNQRWYPYVMTPRDGTPEVLMHHELADTDMGDLTMRELTEWHGPLTINAEKPND